MRSGQDHDEYPGSEIGRPGYTGDAPIDAALYQYWLSIVQQRCSDESRMQIVGVVMYQYRLSIVQQRCCGDVTRERRGAMTMQIVNVLATMPVADHDAAVAWYRRFFNRPADDAPMAGLAEWFFPDTGGVQVFAAADHAGAATLTLGVADIDQTVATLAARGIQAGAIDTGVKSRFTNLTDPAGNTIVLAQDTAPAS